VSTGNPSRPARDDNDILFQLLLCRKFHTHGGERIRNTWALLILFFFYCSYHLARISSSSFYSSTDNQFSQLKKKTQKIFLKI
jgi:hypothetical protein